MALESSDAHYFEKLGDIERELGRRIKALGDIERELGRRIKDTDQKESQGPDLSMFAGQGFQVRISQRSYRRAQTTYYCRIRNQEIDQTFQGATVDIAISKAIESLQPAATSRAG